MARRDGEGEPWGNEYGKKTFLLLCSCWRARRWSAAKLWIVCSGYSSLRSFQGLMTRTVSAAKSLVWRVARVLRLAMAIPAIWVSLISTVMPWRRRLAAISPAASAAGSSKGRTRPSKTSCKAKVKASSNFSRRLPFSRMESPRRISKTVMAVVQMDSRAWRSNQFTTVGSGVSCITAERMLVSRIIMPRNLPFLVCSL